MKVTKSYQDLLGIMKKVAEVVLFLQDEEKAGGPKTLLLSNLQTMARHAGDGLLVLLRRWEKELAGDNVGTPTIQGSLFPPTPADRLATEADLRAMIETWFTGDVDHDDEGRQTAGLAEGGGAGEPDESMPAAFDLNAFAASLKSRVYEAGEGGIAEDVVVEALDSEIAQQGATGPPAGGEADLYRVLTALINTGDLSRETVEEGTVAHLVTTDPALNLDIAAMLAAQPGLGDGPFPSDQIQVVMLPPAQPTAEEPPELVDVVSRFVHEHGPTDRALVTDGVVGEDATEADTEAVGEALDWLTERGRIDQYEDEEGAPTYFRRMSEAADFEVLDDADVRAFYGHLTGKKPGRKTRETLIGKILAHRAESAGESADAGDQPPAEGSAEVTEEQLP